MPHDQRFIAPIDQMLRTVGLAYMQNRSRYFGADDFFPYMDTGGNYSFTIYVEEALGSLRAESARASDETGYPTVSFRGKPITGLAEDWGFQSLITRKQRSISQVPGSSIEVRRTRMLTEKLHLAREVRAEAKVDAVAPSVSLSGTAKWNSTAAAPRTDIMTGKKTMLQYTGREPTYLGLTGTVTDDLITRSTTGSAGLLVSQAIQYVMAATGRQINEPLIAAYFDVERVRFLKGVQQDPTKKVPAAVGGALPQQGKYIWDQDEAMLVYNEPTPSPETSNYGMSPGPLSFGAAQFPDPWNRGTWIQVFQALIEYEAEPKSLYIVGTIL